MSGEGNGAALEAIGAAVARAAPEGLYVVLRHPGRARGAWRVVASEETAEAARGVYDKLAASLRQGAVVLWHGGAALNWRSAPRLRSRW